MRKKWMKNICKNQMEKSITTTDICMKPPNAQLTPLTAARYRGSYTTLSFRHVPSSLPLFYTDMQAVRMQLDWLFLIPQTSLQIGEKHRRPWPPDTNHSIYHSIVYIRLATINVFKVTTLLVYVLHLGLLTNEITTF
eukprot:XP_014769887.1 PREDICTED: uncharacterized protein LOC106868932 [Octopus bimaculoides]